MVDRKKFSLSVRNTGRSISDSEWQAVEPEHIRVWKAATNTLRERTFEFGSKIYLVEANWRPLLNRHVRSHRAMKLIDKNTEQQRDPWEGVKFPAERSNVLITVAAKEGTTDWASSVIQTFIHDFFLILNITAPACCDFYLSTLQGEDHAPDVSLSNVHFDAALEMFLREQWMDTAKLELSTVVNWFHIVREPSSQIANNPMQRVLFAMLHMAKIDASPMVVIWLFYALESLLQTRVGENFSSIVKRLSLLLEIDGEASKLLKQKLRILYDIRSSFVHGGFQITHVVQNELLDERVEENFSTIIQATDFGHALLIAAVRKTIANGWKWPDFDERVRGISL